MKNNLHFSAQNTGKSRKNSLERKILLEGEKLKRKIVYLNNLFGKWKENREFRKWCQNWFKSWIFMIFQNYFKSFRNFPIQFKANQIYFQLTSFPLLPAKPHCKLPHIKDITERIVHKELKENPKINQNNWH